MDLAERVANALGNAKKTAGGFICNCPCHDDRRASLSVAVTQRGGLALNCFAGCDWQDIKTELERRKLLDESSPRIPQQARKLPENPRADKQPHPLSTQSDSNTASDSTPAPTPAPGSTRRDKYNGAKFYTYKDLVGNILCRKVKLPDKKMWFERFESSGTNSGQYNAGLNKMTVPLYNLQAVTTSDLVYLCEGEKDAETLITRGLCATTNHAGAKSWASHLSEQLRGKTVIIIPDNDDAGRRRVAIVSRALQDIAKEIRVFIPDGVPEKGDITDWVESGGDVNTIFTRSIVTERRRQARKATRQEYFDLIYNSLGGEENLKRCIFNEKLMYYDKITELWTPAINALEFLKSEALAQNETREPSGQSVFVANNIRPHFAALEAQTEPEFLVDIPAWDNEDRIGLMAGLIKLKPKSRITDQALKELLKEWCARVFLRMNDPMIQNRILVLQGGQGIGKDTWTSLLVDGLGQFCLPLALVNNDKDTYLSLHRGLILKISEFDKTAKAEVSTLKDIITLPITNIRAPYDIDGRPRMARCSFISSANIENLLRDYTGNRRFLIFEIESIEYAYFGWSRAKIKDWQMQCLAQMRALADSDYKASPESWASMNNYISDATPTDPAEDLKERFLAKVRADSAIVLNGEHLEFDINGQQAANLITELARESGLKYRGVKSMLTQKLGVRRQVGHLRFWVLRIDAAMLRTTPIDTASETEHPEPQMLLDINP